jgi:Flp pilus assembly protein TadG
MKRGFRSPVGRLRRGATAVELALALPVFLTFVFGIVEVSRIRMTSNLLKTASRTGARYGAAEGVSSADVQARVLQILAPVLNTNAVTVDVKDASGYDTGGDLPALGSDVSQLPSLELDDAEPRQLFLVRATVGYNDIALIPFSSLCGKSLNGQAFMRHE